ncbi:MAG: response regulator [Bacillota bacterium]|nr:response regulator [Clostridium sp.]MDT3844934.1 response regulator [Bacillota bacterium]
MRCMVVDDERISMEGEMNEVRKAVPDAEIVGFLNAAEALSYAEKYPIDVAFLDIEMDSMNGIGLAERLEEIQPRINIIFATGYDSYTKKALDLHVSGYLLKPISVEDIRNEMAHLRFPVGEVKQDAIRVRTFGNFEVFSGDKPVKFKYNKTKEMFAYLIDRRGAACSNGEIIGILWEDDMPESKYSYFANCKWDLAETLSAHGAGDALIKTRGRIGIAVDKVDCDFFRFLNGEKDARQKYSGEYMSQFSWAEYTNGWLLQHMKE